MRSWKKTLAVLVFALCVGMLFAACGRNNNNGTNTEGTGNAGSEVNGTDRNGTGNANTNYGNNDATDQAAVNGTQNNNNGNDGALGEIGDGVGQVGEGVVDGVEDVIDGVENGVSDNRTTENSMTNTTTGNANP